MKIAIISTYPPQKCGIATFAKDLYTAMQMASDENIHIIAVSDGREENYPIEVSYIIEKHDYQYHEPLLGRADRANMRRWHIDAWGLHRE